MNTDLSLVDLTVAKRVFYRLHGVFSFDTSQSNRVAKRCVFINHWVFVSLQVNSTVAKSMYRSVKST